eukprot:NODE_4076_length_1234_cov_65.671467_g3582_i0.p1 GENE.NODE_4076_length_1234_cov_65.671467_g3582_i0~~NODE_4076_length_1234_cov_65.671467_g3582_i0.p1  ORF type:complete len:336 (-),score=68.67 NODE_4076_length_1234_cov_65.671467_g3582_i0:162-1169(-)
MKFCIVGAGSIGGFVAAKLAIAGHETFVIARGEHLKAIQSQGLTIKYGDGKEDVVTNLKSTSDIKEVGQVDVVILAVKAHQVGPIADQIPLLLHKDSSIVTMQNGIPFWYFHKHGGELENYSIKNVDADGLALKHIPCDQVIGCVVYPACILEGPGVIRHVEGYSFPLGELDGNTTERVKAISNAFEGAGLKSPILPKIRDEIWLKLWGNMTFNPISALTHATLVDMAEYPDSKELCTLMMQEAQAVANKLGVEFRVTLERRIAGAARVGKHKTSTLQDIEAGRPMEVDALLGSVLELAKKTQVPTPHLYTVYCCVKLLGHVMEENKVCVKSFPL